MPQGRLHDLGKTVFAPGAWYAGATYWFAWYAGAMLTSYRMLGALEAILLIALVIPHFIKNLFKIDTSCELFKLCRSCFFISVVICLVDGFGPYIKYHNVERRSTVAHGISISEKASTPADIYYFTDGYVASDLQKLGNFTYDKLDSWTQEVYREREVFALAPVFPKCEASDCIGSTAGFVAMAWNRKIMPTDGMDCLSSKLGGLCGYIDLVFLKFQEAFALNWQDQVEKIKSTCRDMTKSYDNIPQSACDAWPYMVLGDGLSDEEEGLRYGHWWLFFRIVPFVLRAWVMMLFLKNVSVLRPKADFKTRRDVQAFINNASRSL